MINPSMDAMKFTINLGLLFTILSITVVIANKISYIEYQTNASTAVNVSQQAQITAMQLQIVELKEKILVLQSQREN